MDDADLIKLFASTHDEAAFAALVERHGPMVLGICRRILRNSADADDAFQATFILLAMKAGKIRQPHLLGNWLFGAATRTALNARRANQRRAGQEKRLMKILREKSRDDTADADLHLTLDEEINRLPDKYRRVIVSCYLQGMTKREAAKHLNWPEGTVATRLGQAKEMLRKRLSGQSAPASLEGLTAALAPIAVPVSLSASTVKAAALAAAGKFTAAAAISAKAVGAAKAASKAMMVAKIKLAVALLVVSSLAVTGARMAAQQRTESEPVSKSSPALTLPPEVERALRRNAEQLDPIDLSWNQRNRPDIPREQALALLKSGPFIFVASTREFVFQRGNVYARILTPDNAGKNEVSFDGKILYLGNSGGRQVPTLSKRLNSEIVRKERPNGTGRGDTWFGASYFEEIGLQVPSTAAELQRGRAESAILWLLAQGATIDSIGSVSMDGTSLLKLWLLADNPLRKWADATDRAHAERIALGMSPQGRLNFFEIWEKQKKLPLRRDFVFFLDPQLGYVVVRRQERYGPQLLLETVNTDFEQVPGRSLWLPRKSLTQHFASPNNPGVYSDVSIYTQIIELTEMKLTRAPNEQFVLNYTAPGTRVSDQTLPGKPLSYVVHAGVTPPPRPSGPATQVAARPQTYQPLANVPELPQPIERSSMLIWVIVFIIVAAVALGAWRFRRTVH